LYVDGKLIAEHWEPSPRLQSKSAFIDLEAGHAYDVKLEYFDELRDAEVRFAWQPPGAKPPFDEAVDAARSADVVVFVGGLTGDVEGEEMKVTYPGFAGGDRTDLRLPATQQKLLEALHATGKPVVLVLTTGSALAVDWAKANLPAILVAWYPGQRGGNAVADVLFGNANPGGRLPITFYKADTKLPAFDDYSMRGRTYRYFDGEPLYPFGYGLSYSKFEYSNLKLDRSSVASDGAVRVSATIKNMGSVAGDEVAQLYLHPISPKRDRAVKELRGIERVSLNPGESKMVTFEIRPDRDLTIYDESKKAYSVDPGAYEVQLGASSADIRQRSKLTVM
jgi:beta-glucosidase